MVESKALLKKALTIQGAGIHWYGKAESRMGRKMAHLTVTADNFTELKGKVELLGLSKEEHCLKSLGPRVGIIMGSDSDLPIMQDAAKILEDFGVTYEITVVSAHRTPTRMYEYAQSAVDRGIKVIIAGAGGAAHLPGRACASLIITLISRTPLVIVSIALAYHAMPRYDTLLKVKLFHPKNQFLSPPSASRIVVIIGTLSCITVVDLHD